MAPTIAPSTIWIITPRARHPARVPRFRQDVTCECGHHAWREIETPTAFHPEPDPTTLERSARCNKCGQRGTVRVAQANIGARWNDAFEDYGVSMEVVTFENCARIDRERAERGAETRARRAARQASADAERKKAPADEGGGGSDARG